MIVWVAFSNLSKLHLFYADRGAKNWLLEAVGSLYTLIRVFGLVKPLWHYEISFSGWNNILCIIWTILWLNLGAQTFSAPLYDYLFYWKSSNVSLLLFSI